MVEIAIIAFSCFAIVVSIAAMIYNAHTGKRLQEIDEGNKRIAEELRVMGAELEEIEEENRGR